MSTIEEALLSKAACDNPETCYDNLLIYTGYLGFLQNVKGLSRDRMNAAESIFQDEGLVQDYLNWLDVSRAARCLGVKTLALFLLLSFCNAA